MWQREQCQCPLMLADSESQDRCDHSPNQVMIMAKQGGGSEMGKYPSVSEGRMMLVYLPDLECSHPHKEGPSPPVEGWLHTLHQR